MEHITFFVSFEPAVFNKAAFHLHPVAQKHGVLIETERQPNGKVWVWIRGPVDKVRSFLLNFLGDVKERNAKKAEGMTA